MKIGNLIRAMSFNRNSKIDKFQMERDKWRCISIGLLIVLVGAVIHLSITLYLKKNCEYIPLASVVFDVLKIIQILDIKILWFFK